MKKAFYEKLFLFFTSYVQRLGWVNGALLVLSLALLPFLILAAYCHPSADDFWLTNMVIAQGPWQAQADIRQNWSGRYTSMFLGSFNPLVYRSFTFYKILPVLFFTFLTIGLYRFLVFLTQKQFSRKVCVALALAFLIIYLHQMHTVAQSFYWMSGAITYQTANILLVFFLASWYRYSRLEVNEQSWGQKISITFLLVATIGCNETTMAMVAFLIGCLVLISVFKRRADYFLIWLAMVTVVACSLVILAPGNTIRSQEYPLQHDLDFALVYALLVPVNNSLNWLVNSPVFLISGLLLLAVAQKLPQLSLFTRIHPVVALIILYGCLASGYFVAYWSKHAASPPRAQDTIYFVFLLGWLVNLFIFIPYAQQRYTIPTLPGYATHLLLIWGIAFVFYSKQSHVRTAYVDLLSGQASRYNQEMQARYTALKSSS